MKWLKDTVAQMAIARELCVLFVNKHSKRRHSYDLVNNINIILKIVIIPLIKIIRYVLEKSSNLHLLTVLVR